ncbi:diacylglycerol kinase [Thermovibrio sp.]
MLRTLKGIVKGIKYALEGYLGALKEDRHFRINFTLSLIGFFLSLALLKGIEGLFVAYANLMVLAFELLNTAVERAVDTATSEFKESAKLAKDASAAAVLTVGLFALFLDLTYIFPKLLEVIR